MKLHYAPTSPYVRKCRAAAIELGLQDQIALVAVNPRENGTGYERINPLARIPALELEDGSVLFDSAVICEYLDHLAGGKLIPVPGPSRWQTLKLQAMGDGIMDAAVPRRLEVLRPAEQQSAEQLRLYRRSIDQTLDTLEKTTSLLTQITIGTLSLACALGYLDFRFAEDRWRTGRPKLAEWFTTMAARPSLAETMPPT